MCNVYSLFAVICLVISSICSFVPIHGVAKQQTNSLFSPSSSSPTWLPPMKVCIGKSKIQGMTNILAVGELPPIS